ncbi:hypothetical protein [Megalodesulfovibrio gigas]|uniref:hypothetical protein n=1 Tax=Megalodesulfovibrio gigas TaxID=879 RepID=UPI000483E0EC|nr:hypothetical protein [Megalodesulfovibrio gigas]
MRRYYEDRYHRNPVEFTVGMKGYLLRFLGRVQCTASMTDAGQCGLIAALDGERIWTSEPVDFMGFQAAALYLQLPGGSPAGPFVVQPTEHAHCVTGALPAETKTIQHDDVLATQYTFVVETAEPMDVRVLRVEPQGINSVRVVGNLMDRRVYLPVGTAPAEGSAIGSLAPCVAATLQYRGESGGMHQFTLSWSGSATVFDVRALVNGATYAVWAGVAAYSLSFATPGLPVEVWVVPHVNGQPVDGQKVTASYNAVAVPQHLRIVTMDGAQTTVAWDAVAGIATYQVSIHVDGALKAGASTTDTAYTVTTTQLQLLGGPWPEMEVRVAAVTAAGTPGGAATLTIVQPPLPAPTGLAVAGMLTAAAVLTWQPVAGATGYAVLLGSPENFGPADGSQVYTGTATSAVVAMDATPPYLRYVRAAATDVARDLVDLNWSSAVAVVDATNGLVTHTGALIITDAGSPLAIA